MIPVHAPVIGDDEFKNVTEALLAGEVSGSFGAFIPRFEEAFAAFCGCKHGIAVSSGSTALHLAAVVAGIDHGDEVLVSASTNIATANAVVQQGGIVVPIDAEPATWNMDVRLLEQAITPRTKAILPVHLFGHPVNMRAVMNVALKHNLIVIEDCAQAHGAEFQGQAVGSFGDMGCFSFYANKVITTGEGGMIVTNNDEYAEKARLLRNLAFGTPRFLHHEVGFNYRMTNLQAALGCAQLSRIEETLARKRAIARRYSEQLAGVRGLRLPIQRAEAWNIYWMYGLVLEQEFDMSRDEFTTELKKFGVDTRTMFCPMNLQPSLLKRGAVVPRPCPEAEYLWTHGLYLPSGCSLTDFEIDAICHVIQEMSPACA